MAQTYDVNGHGDTSPPGNSQQNTPANEGSQGGTDLGWGSSIDVARQARAAQDALKRNDYAAAISFAERAVKSAPENPELWFLLGYCARLEEHYPAAVDAYRRGLKIQPNSARGMAGLAQTYARMGRDAEAEELLKRVVDANPKDGNSLQLAGELLLNTDPAKSLEFLQRADAVQ
ncbi:MAG: tetratricopeptide repeat protein, partial [Candidatus Sulfotelmatobacter sp.]